MTKPQPGSQSLGFLSQHKNSKCTEYKSRICVEEPNTYSAPGTSVMFCVFCVQGCLAEGGWSGEVVVDTDRSALSCRSAALRGPAGWLGSPEDTLGHAGKASSRKWVRAGPWEWEGFDQGDMRSKARVVGGRECPHQPLGFMGVAILVEQNFSHLTADSQAGACIQIILFFCFLVSLPAAAASHTPRVEGSLLAFSGFVCLLSLGLCGGCSLLFSEWGGKILAFLAVEVQLAGEQTGLWPAGCTGLILPTWTLPDSQHLQEGGGSRAGVS